jgi:hypothetical protein
MSATVGTPETLGMLTTAVMAAIAEAPETLETPVAKAAGLAATLETLVTAGTPVPSTAVRTSETAGSKAAQETTGTSWNANNRVARTGGKTSTL